MVFTNDLIRTAFRKLKASVYFDKTMLSLRDKVVKFEASQDFTEKMNELKEAYNKALLDESSPIVAEILASVAVLPFPKKMQSNSGEKDGVISVGTPKEHAIIYDLQYFIDMDVRGHILGVLWIMIIGKRLDDDCYKHAFGNRLRKSLIWDEESEDEDIKDSPALFEPYFGQYSFWRDGALSCAENVLEKGHDALILTLDLKRFYYNAGVTENAFNDICRDNETTANKKLHLAVFNIIKKYTQALSKTSQEYSGNVLPIGFLPSAVLSNWCLSKFDNGILDYWNPLYYGRYVDDIIIVEQFEKNSKIYQKARDNSLTTNIVIEYFLGGKRNDNAFLFASSNASDSKDDCTIYSVATEYRLSNESRLEFQSDKTRIFALFSDNNSTALINKFKKQIYENVSEFRLMPEIGDAFSQDDFSQFYRIENDATVNKLRGIKDISMDKFELSKFLGKYRVVSGLVDDGKKFTGIIGKMFNDSELIDNYILWERVLEIFITDKDYVGLLRFVKRITTAIEELNISNEKYRIETDAIKESLHQHLISSINRVLSLLWGKEATSITEKLNKTSEIVLTDLRKAYLSTLMSNKYVMAVPAEVIASPSDNKSVNFTDFKSAFSYLISNDIPKEDTSVLLPCFRQAQDIASAMFLRAICGNSQDVGYDIDIQCYITAIRNVNNKPENCETTVDRFDVIDNDKRGISVGKYKTDKLRLAVANVNVSSVSSLDILLKGRKPNRKYSRYKNLADMVNAAIKENVDMLVLPENYVPFEWLSPLAAKAAREGLAIVTGVEHIVCDGKDNQKGNVFNYTAVILPFKYFDSIPTAAVFFQLKKHYSPEEIRLIEGYGHVAPKTGKKRPLYHWKDCYFPVYCCYELTAISDRAEFISWADMVVAVEFNKDTLYFGTIVESLVRDLHCYCVQVNTSEFGDSRIIQPTRSEEKNILSVKGGLNQTLLVGEIDIPALREFQLKNYTLQKDGKFKPTPPGFNLEIVKQHRRKGNEHL